MNDLVIGDDGRRRCAWCAGDPLYERYHDDEWGFPVADDVRLFEKLCLEGFQSGLAWITILRKRESFRRAFAGFEIAKVARFDARRVERLMNDAGIVRNRAKILATVNNAKRYPALVDEFGSLAAFVWSFEPTGRRPTPASTTAESTAMSKALRKRGWAFVGPTTAYAFMQAMGIVNDHFEDCDTHADVERARAAFTRPTPVDG